MRRRQGFTLVELLVSLALIIFIMAILSEAFVTGIKTFRDLKALGDLNARLRTATNLLRDDLSADHFTGRKRLSDLNFWSQGPPRLGFVRLYQGSPLSTNPADPYFLEGTDVDGVESVRATNHAIHLTVKKRGNELKDFFTTKVPLNSPLLFLGQPDSRYQDVLNPNTQILKGQLAEVAWFLRPNGAFAGNTPLFALYRRQLLVVPDNRINWSTPPLIQANQASDYLEVSAQPRTINGQNILYVNNPTDLTVPQRRFGMDPNLDGGVFLLGPSPNYANYPILGQNDPKLPLSQDLASADLIMTDVLSFSVRVLLNGQNRFVDLTDDVVQAYSNNNPLFYDKNNRPKLPAVFDTWTDLNDDPAANYVSWAAPGNAKSIPLLQNANNQQISIVALQITLRVWDVKTQQARQVTIIQDM
jgi:prepilin-type N-terminal cleavage/methylation domain-containing protein